MTTTNDDIESRFAAGFKGEKKAEGSPAPEDKPEDKPAETPAGQGGEGEGLTTDTTKGEGEGQGPEGVAIVIAPEGGDGQGPEGEPGMMMGGEGGHGMMGHEGGEGEEVLSPEDQQRKASWEGRLKAREKEIADREAALASRESPATPATQDNLPGEATGETPATEASEAGAAAMLADAPPEIQEIAQRWSLDFGDEFIGDLMKMTGYLASKEAANAVGPLTQETAQLRDALGGMADSFNGMTHMDVADEFPDYEQMLNSPEFEAWFQGQDPARQEKIVAVLQGGSQRAIRRLLRDYTQSQGAADEAASAEGVPAAPATVDTSALEAAAGVRSSGAAVPKTSGGAASEEDAFAKGFYGKVRK